MNQQTINVFARWQVKEGKLNTVLDLLAGVAKQSRAEEGNLFYKINQSSTDANTLLLFEAYKDEAAVADHRGSVHFQTIVVGQIVPLLESREVFVTTEVNI
ncbi:putative quinol monooxygenase [Mucilaginibacter endophyticus]|uniref:putative quinol monooxygenase n=1 Tax=Mucilaginibacter endophyticus TaxID=2675003 RepID=UPI000E0D0CF0|nr:putative quinol monooxygenase [Mucilaginibacter endophyticus]